MQIFGRRPQQKRGSRCFVLLLPLLLIFAVFLILTIVQFPGLDTKGKITDLCLTGFFGLVYILAAMWLYRRTRRFYALGKAENYPCAAIRAKFSRDGRSIEIEFFADDADAVRPFVIADDSEEVFSDELPRTEEQKETIVDTYFSLLENLGKTYSYQEFIPFDLNFLQNKKILCEKKLFAHIFGATANGTQAMNGNEFCLYDLETEWPALKQKWLNKDTGKVL